MWNTMKDTTPRFDPVRVDPKTKLDSRMVNFRANNVFRFGVVHIWADGTRIWYEVGNNTSWPVRESEITHWIEVPKLKE